MKKLYFLLDMFIIKVAFLSVVEVCYMKFKLSFLLALFVCLSSSVFAFSNKYFSVNDNGWDVKRKSDKELGFILKDYIPDEEDKAGLTPSIDIIIKEVDKDKLYKVEYNKSELKELENEVKNKAFKEYLALAKNGSRQFLEENYREASKGKIDEIINNIYEDSGIISSSISKIGKNKSYCVEFKIAKTLFRRFVVISLHRVTIIEFTFPESVDIDSMKCYKDFISSFKNYDKEATSLNFFIYGGMGMNILKIIAIVLISFVVKIFKKFRA